MELLKKLYSISAPSRHEGKMIRFITSRLQKLGIRYYVDKHGNIFATKGKSSTYPCVVAHTDEAHREKPADFQVMQAGDSMLIGYSAKQKDFVGIGADDKNGIWVALKCLEEFDVLKCAFFVSEEIGCVGSNKADLKFFDNCRFVLQCDRKGKDDLIIVASGVQLCSQQFIEAIKMHRFGYSKEFGAMADVQILKERGLNVSGVNISCGYYNPHRNTEFIIIPDLVNCLNFVRHIIRTCTKTYFHKYEKPKRRNSMHFYYNCFGFPGKQTAFQSNRPFFKGSWNDEDDSENYGDNSYNHEIELDTLTVEMEHILMEKPHLTIRQIKDRLENKYFSLSSQDYTTIYESIMGCTPPKNQFKKKLAL